jgi:hypothetical protein
MVLDPSVVWPAVTVTVPVRPAIERRKAPPAIDFCA